MPYVRRGAREAVEVAGAVCRDGFAMGYRSVSFVVGPFVWRVLRLRSEFDHKPVSRDFGDDRRRSHGCAMPIAFDFAGHVRRNWHVGCVEGVERLGDVVVRPVKNRADFQGFRQGSPAEPAEPENPTDPAPPTPSLRSTSASARSAATPSAYEIPHSSISVLEAAPTAHAAHHCSSSSKMASRLRSVSILESATPLGTSSGATPAPPAPPAASAPAPSRSPDSPDSPRPPDSPPRTPLNPPRSARPNRRRTNHHRSRKRPTAHFVEADDHVVALLGNRTFQIQGGNYGNRHQAADPSGTSAKTSWCESSPPMRFNGQYFASPTPTTSEMGTSPCEESF